MVSGVSFRGGALDSARDIINNPQAQQKPQTAPAQEGPKADTFVKPKKKHTALKVIGGLVATAALVVGGLVAGHKLGGFEKLAKAASKDGANVVVKYANRAAEAMKLDNAGKKISEWGKAGFDAVKGLFGKAKEKPLVDDIRTAATE